MNSFFQSLTTLQYASATTRIAGHRVQPYTCATSSVHALYMPESGRRYDSMPLKPSAGAPAQKRCKRRQKQRFGGLSRGRVPYASGRTVFCILSQCCSQCCCDFAAQFAIHLPVLDPPGLTCPDCCRLSQCRNAADCNLAACDPGARLRQPADDAPSAAHV